MQNNLVLVTAPGASSLTKRMVDINYTDIFNRSFTDQERFSSLEDIDVIADGTPLLRIIISLVYSAVCVAGLVGNLLVFFLMKARRDSKRSTINFFVLNLAVTDIQFVLTLPFWAVDTALDFSWPFGDAMCKIILSVTVMNMYASVFFLTAMSITRYRSVASAPRSRSGRLRCSVRWAAALLWLCATAATAPTSIFSTVTSIAGEKLCLLKFPDGQHWLAFYHLQKILLAFVLPLLIVSACYLLLLRFIRQRSVNSSYPKRRSKVTKTVTIVVLSFFLCWMPNHAITFWGVLVKLNMARWDSAYYMVHTYLFPLSVCLAHVHSCLNPLLYCLMRRDFRRTLKDLLWRISLPVIHNNNNNNNNNNPMRPFSDEFQPQQENTPNVIHLNVVATNQYRLSTINGQWETEINK